jgi:hypothetical protein
MILRHARFRGETERRNGNGGGSPCSGRGEGIDDDEHEHEDEHEQEGDWEQEGGESSGSTQKRLVSNGPVGKSTPFRRASPVPRQAREIPRSPDAKPQIFIAAALVCLTMEVHVGEYERTVTRSPGGAIWIP